MLYRKYLLSQGLGRELDRNAHLDIQLKISTETCPAPPIFHEKINMAQVASELSLPITIPININQVRTLSVRVRLSIQTWLLSTEHVAGAGRASLWQLAC